MVQKSENPNPKVKIHLVGHAHLDLVYRWRWSETVHFAVVETFENVLKLMELDPELVFAQSQLALYEAVEQHHPQLFRKILEKIKTGKWVVVGGMWTESDMNLPDGESLVRQFLVGKNYMREKLGTNTEIAWLPDVFGHNGNLPQILAGCGMKYYVACRCFPPDKPIFWWEGRDGSRVLAYRFPDHYSGEIRSEMFEIIDTWLADSPVNEALFLTGEGDHGGGPRKGDLENLKQINRQGETPLCSFIHPTEYFDKINLPGLNLPVVKGELNFFARGCYTTQARVKWMNRAGENLLVTAEKFETNARFIHRKSAGQRWELTEAWKKLLWLQFHDNLPGTSIGPVYDDNETVWQQIEALGKGVLEEALETIGARINTTGEGIPIVVYNPLAWERSEPVRLCVKVPKILDELVAVDENGITFPVQILAMEKDLFDQQRLQVLFCAKQIPALGYRLFRLQPARQINLTHALQAGPTFLENKFLRVKINPDTGQIDQVFDKTRNRNVLSAPAGMQIIPEAQLNTAWTMRLGESVELPVLESSHVVENGPVRAALELNYFWGDSRFQLKIALHGERPQVNLKVTVDWHQPDTCLKLAFPLTHQADTASFEIPFGHIDRPTGGEEVPALKWLDLSDENGGASLLNDSKYGCDASGNVLRMTLLRGANDMDPRADDGEHSMRLVFYPHSGDWRQAQTIRRAYELNAPLLTRRERKHIGSQAGWSVAPEDPLPSKFSFLGIAPENLILTTMKTVDEAFGPREIVVRFFESHGTSTIAELNFPVEIESAVECNLIEEPTASGEIEIAGKVLRLPVPAYAIKTIRVKYRTRFMGALPGGWQGMEQDA